MLEFKRAQRRAAGPELPAPSGLRTGTLDLGAEQYLVLSHALVRWELPAALTAAEREIVSAVLDGKSREEVAKERGTSARTVANLVAQVFRKLGVGSRIELAALVTAREPGMNA